MKLSLFEDNPVCSKCGNNEVKFRYFEKCATYKMRYPYAERYTSQEHIACTCARCHFQWCTHPKQTGSEGRDAEINEVLKDETEREKV